MAEYKKTVITKDQVVPIAEKMRKAGNCPCDDPRLHRQRWADGRLMDYAVDPAIESYHVIGETVLPSIGELYDTAATWPERELNELFAIEFEGLDVSQRLFLPEDMLETQGKGQIMVMPLSELRQKNIEEGTK